LKPTIVAATRNETTGQMTESTATIIRQVLKPDTAEALKDALFQAIDANDGLRRII
jgi:hypothetical protein